MTLKQQHNERRSGLPPGKYTIVFDGGSIGNPGHGYGSFRIVGPHGQIALERLNFDHISLKVTNNQAEYRSLIGALEMLIERLGPYAPDATVIVNGDSMLVINQLRGAWKVRNEGLRPLFERAAELLKTFKRTELSWHDRSNSVRILGH